MFDFATLTPPIKIHCLKIVSTEIDVLVCMTQNGLYVDFFQKCIMADFRIFMNTTQASR